jgi:hypothetical protein
VALEPQHQAQRCFSQRPADDGRLIALHTRQTFGASSF